MAVEDDMMTPEEYAEQEKRQERMDRVDAISRKVDQAQKALKRINEVWGDSWRNGGLEYTYGVLMSEISFAKDRLDTLRVLLKESRNIV